MKIYFSAISTALIIGLIFFLVRIINLELLHNFSVDMDFLHWIYLPSGVRVLAVLLFGWIGGLGIFIGWVFCHLLSDEKSLLECVFIGLLSGSSALFSLWVWQLWYKPFDVIKHLNPKHLGTLVVIAALVTSLVKTFYIYSFDPESSLFLNFWVGLIGDLTGSYVALHLIKFFQYFKNELLAYNR